MPLNAVLILMRYLLIIVTLSFLGRDAVAPRMALSDTSPETSTVENPNARLEPLETDKKQPLQGYLKHDSKGTPVVPEWKIQAGYDALIGTFYVGLVGFKLLAVNGPMGRHAVLGKDKLLHWNGYKPHPCMLKFTKLTDDSGGYYFNTVACEKGPRGWLIPQPIEPHKARKWAIYFMQ